MQALDKQYRRLTLKLGLSLLLMFLLLQAGMTGLAFLKNALAAYLSPALNLGVYLGLYCLVYLLCFLLPIPFFKLLSLRTHGQPIFFELRLPRGFLPLCLAMMSAATLASYINALLVAPFGVQGTAEPLLDMLKDGEPYVIAAMFLMLVIVPPVCEELLLRGLVMGNLLPYGRGVAIFGSALLFAAMHQNFSQFLYAFVAGILLGLMYERTRSIWPCTLFHLLNNLWSFVQLMIVVRMPDQEKAAILVLGLNGVLILVGAICALLVLLVRVLLSKKPEKTETACKPERPVRGFFSPAIIVFLIMSVGMAVLNLILGAKT